MLCKIEEKWLALALPLERLQEIWRIGNYGDDVRWLYFFAIAATQVAPVSKIVFKPIKNDFTSLRVKSFIGSSYSSTQNNKSLEKISYLY